jgi:hypothetical protein
LGKERSFEIWWSHNWFWCGRRRRRSRRERGRETEGEREGEREG